MVSAGTVTNHSNDVTKLLDNYIKSMNDLSSSWKGASYDNLINKSKEFHTETKQVTNELLAFAEAITYYESYIEEKAKYQKYAGLCNDSNLDPSKKSEYQSLMNDCEVKMREYKEKINEALTRASSYKMSASSANTTSADTTTSEASTTTSDTETKEVSTNGGEFVKENRKSVYGHITSSIDGTTHTIYNQSQIDGWAKDCNRAAASSIASAFTKYDGEAVDIAKKSDNGIGYNNKVTNQYFSNFGLKATVDVVNGSYDSKKDELVETLKNGNYVMFDLSKPNVKGKSGQRWTGVRHWLSVLDIKKTGDGPEDYAIFVSDSGHGGSTKNYGLGTGWYSIDEFDGQKIANFTTVSKA